MGRQPKKKKKQPKRQSVSSAEDISKKGTSTEASSKANKTSLKQEKEKIFILSKSRLSLKKGRLEEAEKFLAKAFPEDKSAINPEKLKWLSRFWVDKLLSIFAAEGKNFLNNSEVADVFASVVLKWTDEQFSQLAHIDSPLITEARLIRKASTLIAEGNDSQAMELLREISLRSPFRSARLFLKGLSALYLKEDDTALKAFEGLLPSEIYGGFARSVICGVEQEQQEKSNQEKNKHRENVPTAHGTDQKVQSDVQRALGLERASQVAMLEDLRCHLIEKRKNTALSVASHTVFDPSSAFYQYVKRDLASALIDDELEPMDAVKRLSRAIRKDPNDPNDHHLKALLLDTIDLESAQNHWDSAISLLPITVFNQSQGAYSSKEVEAAICFHMAKAYKQLAKNENDAWESSILVQLALLEEDPSDYLDEAVRLLEDAIDFDPSSLEYWQELLKLVKTTHVIPEKNAKKILSRFIKQFPDEPEVLIAGAEDALERADFGEGIKYVQRAAALEPLNRKTRDLEMTLLAKKAQQWIRANGFKQARETYEQAAKISGCTPKVKLQLLAEHAVFEMKTNQAQAALDLRKKALKHDFRPWLWTGFFLQGAHQVNFFPSQKKKRAARILKDEQQTSFQGIEPTLPTKQLKPSVDTLIEKLVNPPEEQELVELLQLAKSFKNQKKNSSIYYSSLLEKAVDLAGSLLKQKNLIEDALAYARGPTRLKLAEHGLKLFPEHTLFLFIRYQVALALNMPPAYFAEAKQEISNHLERLEIIDDCDDRESSIEAFEQAKKILEMQQAFGDDWSMETSSNRSTSKKGKKRDNYLFDDILEIDSHGNPFIEAMKNDLLIDDVMDELQKLMRRIGKYTGAPSKKAKGAPSKKAKGAPSKRARKSKKGRPKLRTAKGA